MRQKRIDPEQRAEVAASQPAAAIEGLRPFTAKQGQYLAFIYVLPRTFIEKVTPDWDGLIR